MGYRTKRKFRSDWETEEGVFKTPQNKFIVRIRKGSNNKFTTVSKHGTEEEADAEYKRLTN